MKEMKTEDRNRIEKEAIEHFDKIGRADDGNEMRAWIQGATRENERMAELLKEERNKAIDPEIIEALLACETTLKAFLPDAFATISIVEQAIKKAKGKSQ